MPPGHSRRSSSNSVSSLDAADARRCSGRGPENRSRSNSRYGPFERKGADPCGGRSNYVIKRFINNPANPNTRTTSPIIPATNPTFLCSNASAISARPHSYLVSLPRLDEPPPSQTATQPKAAMPMRQWQQPSRQVVTSCCGSRDRAVCGKRALSRSPPRRR